IAAIAAVLPVSAATAGAGARHASTPTSTPPKVPAAVADKPFIFFGSGWGHGVGLSQWGAYGLAQDGWTRQQILTHFYSGTHVGPIATQQAPDTLRVGLTWGNAVLHLTANGGPVPLVVGSPDATGAPVASVPEGMTWTVGSSGGQFQVLNAKGKQVGGQPWGSETQNLYAMLGGTGAGHLKVAE